MRSLATKGTGKLLFVLVFTLCSAGVAADTVLVSAVLPSSRSVPVNVPATVFATIINAGTEQATNCRVEIETNTGEQFSFQTTDPLTNAPVGTVNTPVNLAPGAAQTFLLVLQASERSNHRIVRPRFQCDNAPTAAQLDGVNSFSFSASTSPVADVIALVATPSLDGIVTLPNRQSANVFTVAAVNVGSADNLTVSVIGSSATSAAAFSICQTNPITSVCTNPPQPTSQPVNLILGQQATATFGVFIAAEDDIAFDPAQNRAELLFTDSLNELRGSTSVALRTRARPPNEPLQITDSIAERLVTRPLRFAEDTLNLQAAFLRGLIFLFNNTPTQLALPCGTGNALWELQDRDDDGRPGIGESVELRFSDCDSPDLIGHATGTLAGSIESINQSDSGFSRITGTIEITEDLAVLARNKNYAIRGSYAFSYTVGPTGKTSEVFTQSDDRLFFTELGATSQWQAFHITQSLARPKPSISIRGDFEDEGLGGSSSCEVVEATGRGFQAASPEAGTLICRGANDGEVRLDSQPNTLATLSLRPTSSQPERVLATDKSWLNFQRHVPVFFNHALVDLNASTAEPAPLPLTRLEIAVEAVVYNSARNELVIANETGLLVLDVRTLSIVRSTSLPQMPSALALGDDQQTLYVAYRESSRVDVVDAISLLTSNEFSLGSNAEGREYRVAHMRTAPGNSSQLVVTRGREDFLGLFQGIAVYADGMELPNTFSPQSFRMPTIVVTESGRLFTDPLEGTTENGLQELTINADGISAGILLRAEETGFSDPKVAVGEKLISDSGIVFDLNTSRIEGLLRDSFGFSSPNHIVADADAATLYRFGNSTVVYDLSRFVGVAAGSVGAVFPKASFAIDEMFVLVAGEGITLLPQIALAVPPQPGCGVINLEEFIGPQGVLINCRIEAAQYSASRNEFVVILPSSAGRYGNSIASMNPDTGVLGEPTYVGSAPTRLALTNDGARAFVALEGGDSVVQFELSGTSRSLSQPIPNNLDGFPIAKALAVSPENSDHVLVGVGTSRTVQELYLLQNGVFATDMVSGTLPQTMAFDPDDATVAYGARNGRLQIFDVSSSGVTRRNTLGGLISGQFVVANGAIYTAQGKRLDLDTTISETVFDLPGATSDAIAYDFSADHLYYYQRSPDRTLFVVNSITGSLVVEYPLNLTTLDNITEIVLSEDAVLFLTANSDALLLPKSTIFSGD